MCDDEREGESSIMIRSDDASKNVWLYDRVEEILLCGEGVEEILLLCGEVKILA